MADQLSSHAAAATGSRSEEVKATIVMETGLDDLPGYEIVRNIGHGSFGVVRLAKRTTGPPSSPEVLVAVKSLDKLKLGRASVTVTTAAPDDVEAAARPGPSPAGKPSDRDARARVAAAALVWEGKVLRTLHARGTHPNIIGFVDVVESPTALHLVIEYMARGDLHMHVARKGAFTEDAARALFVQIVDAVRFVHAHEFVHRDIKLDNILLSRDGSVVKLSDFGLAKRFTPGVSLRSFAGSPPFASPEVHHGLEFVGPEADVWSLGIVLYVMVVGALPFDGANLAALRAAVWAANPVMPKQLSPEIVQILRRCFARNPAHRPDTQTISDAPWYSGARLASPGIAVTPKNDAMDTPLLTVDTRGRRAHRMPFPVHPATPPRPQSAAPVMQTHANGGEGGPWPGPPPLVMPTMAAATGLTPIQAPRSRSADPPRNGPVSAGSVPGNTTGGPQPAMWGVSPAGALQVSTAEYAFTMGAERLGVVRGSVRRLFDSVARFRGSSAGAAAASPPAPPVRNALSPLLPVTRLAVPPLERAISEHTDDDGDGGDVVRCPIDRAGDPPLIPLPGHSHTDNGPRRMYGRGNIAAQLTRRVVRTVSAGLLSDSGANQESPLGLAQPHRKRLWRHYAVAVTCFLVILWLAAYTWAARE
ncbi:kinase-like domain-containing protein [Blastocladiella britannica]|nr:kinase-like domain-containing protein [Blastocladiella britannica]